MGERILFVSHSAEWLGPTKSLFLLLRHLRRSYEVTVLLPGTGRLTEELSSEGIPVLALPTLTKRHLPALIRMVRRQGFDLVYANNTRRCARLAFVAAALARVPFVCHVRSMEWRKSWLDLGYLRYADAVIAVSNACAASVKRFVRPGRLHVAYNGVPVDGTFNRLERTRREVRHELGLSHGSLILLSSGHVYPRKGQEYAVRAMIPLLKEFPTAHLCLTGRLDRDPAYVDRLRVLIRENGLGDHVHFLGYRRDILRLLCSADVLVHTAVADPHPRAVIEAMSAALPVVAFAVDGVAETVVNGETGYLVERGKVLEMAEAVAAIARNPCLRERMGRAGRARVETCFADDRTAERVQRVLAGVLSARARADD